MCSGRRFERGITYIGVLSLVTLIALMLAMAAPVLSTALRRDKEAQLLWVGHQYREAIARYVAKRGRYPASIESLLEEPNATGADHFLRQAYADPMTGNADWIWITAEQGGLKGVASSSEKAPLKSAGFDEEDVGFAKAQSYAGWQFVYDPNLLKPEYRTGTFGAPAPN